MKLSFTLFGEPIARARHRVANGRMYNPQSAEDAGHIWEIRRQLKEQTHEGFRPIDKNTPLAFEMQAYFARPKYHYGTGRNEGKLKTSAPEYPHLNSKDFDNIVKRVCDLMNAIVYIDDRQIVNADNIRLRYALYETDPRTVFTITTIEE